MWNKTLNMELFESDYEIMRNRKGWKECPDHSFAKMMTRFYPVIYVALLEVHLYSNIENINQFEQVAFDNTVYHERHDKCCVSRGGVRNFGRPLVSDHLVHHQGACVGSIALLSALSKPQYSVHPGNTFKLLLVNAGYRCRMDGCLRHVSLLLDWQIEERKHCCLGYLRLSSGELSRACRHKYQMCCHITPLVDENGSDCISLHSREFKALPLSQIKLHPCFTDISEDYHYNMWWDGMRDGEKMEASVIGREDWEPLVFIKGRDGDYERLLGFILVDKPDGLKQIASDHQKKTLSANGPDLAWTQST
jgi:hypothetical protein